MTVNLHPHSKTQSNPVQLPNCSAIISVKLVKLKCPTEFSISPKEDYSEYSYSVASFLSHLLLFMLAETSSQTVLTFFKSSKKPSYESFTFLCNNNEGIFIALYYPPCTSGA